MTNTVYNLKPEELPELLECVARANREIRSRVKCSTFPRRGASFVNSREQYKSMCENTQHFTISDDASYKEELFTTVQIWLEELLKQTEVVYIGENPICLGMAGNHLTFIYSYCSVKLPIIN
jgi:hypothetical protein